MENKTQIDLKSERATSFGRLHDLSADRSRSSPPPSGLRGKALGLYYRDRNKKRKESEPSEIKLGPSIAMPQSMIRQIESLLRRSSEKEYEKVSHDFVEHFNDLLNISFEEFIKNSKKCLQTAENDETFSELLKTEFETSQCTPEYRKRFETREKLPALKQCPKILEAIGKNQVILIVGSTGCGKTTQVPQFILNEHIIKNCGSLCKIVCTQPRRISAITVAERVAYERCEDLGTSVGYQIRLQGVMPRPNGSILYCTTGILLQKMQSDPLLSDLTYVILDEIHERSIETDILMALLKKILPFRPNLKVILMSATVSQEEFQKYFDNCFSLNIEGTIFPVEVKYIEDILQETGYRLSPTGEKKFSHGKKKYANVLHLNEFHALIMPYILQIKDKYDADVLNSLKQPESEGVNIELIEYLIWYICENKPSGAILVFLPGYDKISKLNNALLHPTISLGKNHANKIHVYPLHSMMPTVDQKSVFLSPPDGKRKVIISTSIAETSVTIDDVVYVINSGKTKMNHYNIEANIQTLEECWITIANSQQRRGRAGRVQPGICYNIFSRARENCMDLMPTPEILRSKLESVLLNLKLLHISDVPDFMKCLIDAPNEKAIQNGISLLKRINALDKFGVITPLGMHLARLPIDPQMGKMMIMASFFRCIDPITTIAATISFKSPFYTPLGQESRVDRCKSDFSACTKSDHMMLDNVMVKYRKAKDNYRERQFCYNNFLSLSTLEQLIRMKQQFTELLQSAKFIESSNCSDPVTNVTSNEITVLRAVIAAGLYPNMAYVRKSRQIKNRVLAIHSISTPEDGSVAFHPSSINKTEVSFESGFFVYFLKQKSSSIFLMDTTMVYPMALVIFGDHILTGAQKGQHFISLANHYYFKCDQATSDVIIKLRHRFDVLMQKKALYPSPIVPGSNDDLLIKAIQILLSYDDPFQDDSALSD